MVESLIENLHREDLTPTEKGKFCLKIMKEEGITEMRKLARRINIKSDSLVNAWITDYKLRKRSSAFAKADHTVLRNLGTVPEKEAEEIIKFSEKEVGGNKPTSRFIQEEFIPAYKKADEPTKKALLSGKVTVEEAKQENVPEPIQLERTANDVVDDNVIVYLNIPTSPPVYEEKTTTINNP